MAQSMRCLTSSRASSSWATVCSMDDCSFPAASLISGSRAQPAARAAKSRPLAVPLTIRAMSRESEIVLEDAEGEIPQASLEEDLPYDINQPVIAIKPEDYGIWYIDCMDQPERYAGKTVEFTAMVLRHPNFPKDQFVPGRMAMTCCEADMSFLGFPCKYGDAASLKTKDWVRVQAEVRVEYQKEYRGEGPVLYAKKVERDKEIKDIVQF